jgi:hypothetical protein
MRRDCFARAAASVVTLCLTATPRWPAHAAPLDEPEAAGRLFDLCSSRRPSSWLPAERLLIDALVEEVVATRTPWRQEYARGKWRLAYLQRGRNAPLELPFNEQYQIISRSEIVNVAELLGPTLEVRAAGAWREDLPASDQTPKRFRADISQGAVCAAVTMGRSEKANIGRACAERPLSGETYRVFEGEYVGPRLRIGQDLNSGGARVVQVRVDSFAGRR